MPTKDELEQENARLRAELAELRDQQPTAAARPRPQQPDFGLSAGEAADLAANGVTVSPFTGQTLNALDHMGQLQQIHGDDFELTPEARRRAERARTGQPAGVSTSDVATVSAGE